MWYTFRIIELWFINMDTNFNVRYEKYKLFSPIFIDQCCANYCVILHRSHIYIYIYIFINEYYEISCIVFRRYQQVFPVMVYLCLGNPDMCRPIYVTIMGADVLASSAKPPPTTMPNLCRITPVGSEVPCWFSLSASLSSHNDKVLWGDVAMGLVWEVITSIIMCGIKSLIHLQTSTAAPLKFGMDK